MSNKQSKNKNSTASVRSSAPFAILRYIIGIMLTAMGTAWVLSMAASGGSRVMTLLRNYLRGLGGKLSAVLPFLLIWYGAALVVSCYHRVSFRAPFFALLLYLNVLALLTCVTIVRTQDLINYVKTYNTQHYANSFASGSFVMCFRQMFNWGYTNNDLAAGGALSLVFAYPVHQLFGPFGSRLMEGVLTLACLFGLFWVRPTRLIRSASDAMERHRQNRVKVNDGPQKQTPQAAPPLSPIRDSQNPAYSANNPYTNVRWIYDDSQTAQADTVQPNPLSQGYDENSYMRPEPADPAVPQSPPNQGSWENNGPFVSMNTQNDLYHEPFVLHPDGTGDVSDPEPVADDDGPERFARPGRNKTVSSAKKENTYQPIRSSGRSESAQDVQQPAEEPRQKDKTQQVSEEKEDVLPWEDPPQNNTQATPFKQEAPVEQEKAVPSETVYADEAENDEDLSEWQKQLKDIRINLNKTREKRRELDGKKPEPVHIDPVDLPPIDHVAIKPKVTVQEKKDKVGLDDRPTMPDRPPQRRQNGPYTPPPISFLSVPVTVNPGESSQEDEYKAQQIERTLKTFNVDAQVREITHGPAITRFALKLAEGIKVKQVVGVLDNIMLEMGSDRIRIETPIPGTSFIGLEVPNSKVSAVTLREVLDSPEMKREESPLSVALGKDIAGKPIIGDLSKMPHLLIAGATGSGKSVCINSIVCSLLYRASPKDVRLIMVDPKQVELQVYNGIPHLLIPVVCDPKKAAAALNWVVNEMLERYSKFAKQNVRNLKGYNNKASEEDRMAHIVVIIDEMADLMEVCRKDVEESIRRLAALARAAGIYLVLATQRPSVDVITGVIKNNIPSRIAFTVASGVDSRTIIDVNGAEKLMGKGDMLYLPVGAPKPMRVQGCFVSDEEVARISENIQARYQAEYNHAIQDVLEQPTDNGSSEDIPDSPQEVRESEFSDLLSEAIRMAVQDGQTSISMLQRTLRIGYARAGRIIDEMTKRGIISESEGSKPRKTIISREEYLKMMQDGLLSSPED